VAAWLTETKKFGAHERHFLHETTSFGAVTTHWMLKAESAEKTTCLHHRMLTGKTLIAEDADNTGCVKGTLFTDGDVCNTGCSRARCWQ
jgi:hypothetical protein